MGKWSCQQMAAAMDPVLAQGRRRKLMSAAYGRAQSRLVRLHDAEFRGLLAEETAGVDEALRQELDAALRKQGAEPSRRSA